MPETMTPVQGGDAKKRLGNALRRRPDILKDEYTARRHRLDNEFDEMLRRLFPPTTGWPRINALPKGSVEAATGRKFSWQNRPNRDERIDMARTYLRDSLGTVKIDVAAPYDGPADIPTVITVAPSQGIAYWRCQEAGPYCEVTSGLLKGHEDVKPGTYQAARLKEEKVRPRAAGIKAWDRFYPADAVNGTLILRDIPVTPTWFDHEGKVYSVPPLFVPDLLGSFDGLGADLISACIMLASEPWMKAEIRADTAPFLDILDTEVWITDREDWSNRPDFDQDDGKLWCEAIWGDDASPKYASLVFRPGVSRTS